MAASATRVKPMALRYEKPQAVTRTSQLTSKQELITPAQAEQYLENAAHNRHLRKQRVNLYAVDMVNGRWHVTGEPLKFDKNGKLIDGQHRLAALIKADVTVEFTVIRGLESEAQKYMDAGAGRTPQDALALEGFEHDVISAAVISRTIIAMEQQRRATSAEVVDFAEANIERLDQCGRIARNIRNKIGGSVAAYGTAYWYLSERDQVAADQFFSAMETGAALADTDPRLALRNYFVRAGTMGKRSSAKNLRADIAVQFKTWNAWKQGKEIKVMRFRSDENFPELG